MAKNSEQESEVAPPAVMLFGFNKPKRNIIFRKVAFKPTRWVCHTQTHTNGQALILMALSASDVQAAATTEWPRVAVLHADLEWLAVVICKWWPFSFLLSLFQFVVIDANGFGW